MHYNVTCVFQALELVRKNDSNNKLACYRRLAILLIYKVNIINVAKSDSYVAKMFFYDILILVVFKINIAYVDFMTFGYVAFCVEYFNVSAYVSFARNNGRNFFHNPAKSYYILSIVVYYAVFIKTACIKRIVEDVGQSKCYHYGVCTGNYCKQVTFVGVRIIVATGNVDGYVPNALIINRIRKSYVRKGNLSLANNYFNAFKSVANDYVSRLSYNLYVVSTCIYRSTVELVLSFVVVNNGYAICYVNSANGKLDCATGILDFCSCVFASVILPSCSAKIDCVIYGRAFNNNAYSKFERSQQSAFYFVVIRINQGYSYVCSVSAYRSSSDIINNRACRILIYNLAYAIVAVCAVINDFAYVYATYNKGVFFFAPSVSGSVDSLLRNYDTRLRRSVGKFVSLCSSNLNEVSTYVYRLATDFYTVFIIVYVNQLLKHFCVNSANGKLDCATGILDFCSCVFASVILPSCSAKIDCVIYGRAFNNNAYSKFERSQQSAFYFVVIRINQGYSYVCSVSAYRSSSDIINNRACRILIYNLAYAIVAVCAVINDFAYVYATYNKGVFFFAPSVSGSVDSLLRNYDTRLRRSVGKFVSLCSSNLNEVSTYVYRLATDFYTVFIIVYVNQLLKHFCVNSANGKLDCATGILDFCSCVFASVILPSCSAKIDCVIYGRAFNNNAYSKFERSQQSAFYFVVIRINQGYSYVCSVSAYRSSSDIINNRACRILIYNLAYAIVAVCAVINDFAYVYATYNKGVFFFAPSVGRLGYLSLFDYPNKSIVCYGYIKVILVIYVTCYSHKFACVYSVASSDYGVASKHVIYVKLRINKI